MVELGLAFVVGKDFVLVGGLMFLIGLAVVLIDQLLSIVLIY